MKNMTIPSIIKNVNDLTTDDNDQVWLQKNPDISLNTPENLLLDIDGLPFPILRTMNKSNITLYDKNLLGGGGFGKIYLGQDLKSGTFYAVKKQSFTDQTQDEILTEKKVLEAQAELIDIGIINNDVYFVMPLIPGKDYYKTIIKPAEGDKPLTLLDRVEMAIAAVEIVKKYNSEGYLHRDLKLENLMWDPESKQAALIDKAKTVYVGDEDNHSFEANYGDGTLQYMAPELCSKHARYTKKSEIYALGIMLLEILSGHMFKYDTMSAMLYYSKGQEPEKRIASFIKEAFPEIYLAEDNKFGNARTDIQKLAFLVSQDPKKRLKYNATIKQLNKIKDIIVKDLDAQKEKAPPLIFSNLKSGNETVTPAASLTPEISTTKKFGVT